jgi:predicted enzyme related to lactoylglutathione lyase
MPTPTQFLVNIDVDDLASAVRFYTRAFDFTVGRRLGETIVELLGGPAPVYLIAKPNGSIAAPSTRAIRDYARHWTPVHLDLVVDDVDVAVARAHAAGAIVEDPAEDHVWGRIAHLADPFGNGFCVLAFRNRGYDEVAITDKSPPD